MLQAHRRVAAIAATAAGCAALLASMGIAHAGDIAPPPPGTPDPASLVLRPSDFAPRARVQTEQYVTPPSGFLSLYIRTISARATLDGAPLKGVISLAFVTQDAASGHTAYVASTARRDRLFKLAVKLLPGNVHHTHLAPVHALGVGDESSVLPIRYVRHGVRYTAAFAVERVKQAVVFTMLFIRGNDANRSVIRGVASTVADRMHSVLG